MPADPVREAAQALCDEIARTRPLTTMEVDLAVEDLRAALAEPAQPVELPAPDVGAAMQRAFILGQNYCQQADSDSPSMNRKSELTRAKFDEVCTEVVEAVRAALASHPDRYAEGYRDGDAAAVARLTALAHQVEQEIAQADKPSTPYCTYCNGTSDYAPCAYPGENKPGCREPRTLRADKPVMPNLMPVIQWLENGCDPKEAAKELRIYQAEAQAGKHPFRCANGMECIRLEGHAPAAAPAVPDEFSGDNAHLVRCINALLRLDERGALVPHGIGGHARALLASAAARLTAPQAAAVPEGMRLVPVEPTLDMTRTARVNMEYRHCTPSQIWAAMLAAAPQAVPADAPKDHEIAAMVNKLRDIAIQYRDAQQLRERIVHAVVPMLKRAQTQEQA